MIKNQDIQAHAIPIQQSRTVLTDLVFPNDTNHHHTIFGGKV
ncbi:acyl-CoA thioesterase, partial [Peribacillus psychrosaccharolyticus]